MNDTNRVTNRILLLVIGLVFFVAGAAVVAAVAVPSFADRWTPAAAASRAWIDQAQFVTVIEGTTLTWLVIGVLLAVALLIAVLVIALVRSVAGRRSRTVLRGSGAQNPLGRVTVTESFASDALKHSLDARDEILFSAVTANDVNRQPVIHVSVTPRQNTSPRQLTEFVDRLLRNLATLTGQNLPTYISIHSGLRARLAHDQRRLS